MQSNQEHRDAPMPKGVTLLTDHDLAQLFKVSLSSVYRWRKQELLPYFKMGNTCYYVQEVIVPLLVAKGSRGLQRTPIDNQ